VFDDHSFALCLTHDVDRPFKTYQWLHEALRDRDPDALRRWSAGENPYWQFETIRRLEADLDVRSSFYALQTPRLREGPASRLTDPKRLLDAAGRYEFDHPDIAPMLRNLDADGWEVGLHGSYESAVDPARLRREKRLLEETLGHEVGGCRQHYLRLDDPPTETWRAQRDAGLVYDASSGSSSTVGFDHGDRPFRPFDDDFLVFPLTAMEVALPTDPDERWQTCEQLLQEADARGAVATVLWHPRYFAPEFPGYRETYRRLVERAQELGAWVGPVGDAYARLDPADCPGWDHGRLTPQSRARRTD
jgi:peptidoglycan/xylan/chitin deacetylase (PgdA/CDA1 family)